MEFCRITVVCTSSRREEGLSLLTALSESHVLGLKLAYTLLPTGGEPSRKQLNPSAMDTPLGQDFCQKFAHSAWTAESSKMSTHLTLTWLERGEGFLSICLNT